MELVRRAGDFTVNSNGTSYRVNATAGIAADTLSGKWPVSNVSCEFGN
jgi:hypothetical protein